MENENKTQPQEQNNDVQYYIDQLNEIKSTTISKATYDKVVGERDTLKKALFEGTGAPGTEAAKRSADEIRKELFGENMDSLSNLESAKLALELREAVLAEEGKDIFMGSGKGFTPDPNDYAIAQKVADCLSHCVEYADGDTEVFTNELARLTVDVMPNTAAARYNRRR